MKRTAYETLGIKPTATPSEIKANYRRLVLKYHPDTTIESDANAKFLEVTEAYEILIDPDRRKEYDRILKMRAQRAQQKREAPAGSVRSSPPKQAQPTKLDTQETRTKLVNLVSRGKLIDAENLARNVLAENPRSSLCYSILSDIHRARGETRQAFKMMAYAVQFEPANAIYNRKHDELLEVIHRAEQAADTGPEASWVAPFVGLALCVIAACYVALSPERPVFDRNSLIATWTVGLMGCALSAGAMVGACMSMGDLVEPLEVTNSYGRVSASFVFMILACVNLWIAGVVYLLIGSMQGSFIVSVTRMLLAMIAALTIMTIGASLSHSINPYEVFAFGGSLVAFGALLGWVFADSFKQAPAS